MKPLITILLIFAGYSQAVFAAQAGSEKLPEVSTYDSEEFVSYQRNLQILRRDFADDIPFYLNVPKQRPLKGIMILLHGITSSKGIWWQNEGPYSKKSEYLKGLLEAGYVVVTPDARWHGQRIAAADFNSPMKILATQNWSALRSLIEGSVTDFELILDHVAAQFPELEIGVLGMSLGGMQSFVLATNDKRIKLAVPIFTPLQDLAHQLDDIQPMIRARRLTVPTLLLVSDRDVWYSLAQGKALYEAIAAEDKELLILSTPHELGYSEAEKVVAWISERL